jgi:hypothetical protein
MLKLAADLSNNYSWGLVWGGQSNSRPWGSKAEGYQASPEYQLEANGTELAGVVIDAYNGTGNGKKINVTTALTPNQWQGAQLRLYRQAGGSGNPQYYAHYTDPLGGYATVVTNTATTLIVDWVVPVVDETGAAFTGTCKGYLTFADDKWKSYQNVKVLTPYQPEGLATDVGTRAVAYPSTAATKLGIPGYSHPATVTSFSDLAAFLPLTFLEGIDSYGCSNFADSAWGVTGARSLHYATSSTFVLASANSPARQDPSGALAGGNFYVEWTATYASNPVPKRSWCRIANNSRYGTAYSTFTVQAGTWSGDGAPSGTTGADVATASASVISGTSPITITKSSAFSGVQLGDIAYHPPTGAYGIVSSIAGVPSSIQILSWISGSVTGTADIHVTRPSQATSRIDRIEAWIPHYLNNPNALLGPGYRYPNNDMLPYAFAGAYNNGTLTSTTTSAPGATTIITQSTASWEPNKYAGWYVSCGSSVGLVTGNTKTELIGSWISGGTPGGAAVAFTLSNELGTGPRIHNRPCGITPYAYGDRFGSLLPFASRMSASIGKDVHAVHLGVNSSPIFQQTASNSFGFPGQVGWWNWREHLTWAPEKPNGQAERLARMMTFMAPAAITAAGSTKPFRVLSFTWLQGEGDALGGKSRTNYGRSLNALVTWLRDAATDAGVSPYSGEAKIPWIQPRITKVPYELTGQFTYYNQLANYTITLTLSGDDEGWVNNHIEEFSIVDGFAACLPQVDDLPKLGETSLVNGIDPLHYDGVGEAMIGERLSELAGRVIEKALAYGGSTYLQRPSTRLLYICNLALAHIGQTQITSLDDGSTPAELCKQFFPEARDTMLQSRQWGFALRREELSEVMKPPPSFMGGNPLYDQYGFCYAIPHEALNAFAVLPPSPDSDYIQLGHETEGQWPQLIAGGPAPVAFAVETSPMSGGRLLFTNQQDAVLRYVARIVDADRFTPMFATALSWYLASMLASAIIKGDEGEKVSQRCLQKAAGFMRLAASSDGNQRGIKLQHIPDHLLNR